MLGKGTILSVGNLIKVAQKILDELIRLNNNLEGLEPDERRPRKTGRYTNVPHNVRKRS